MTAPATDRPTPADAASMPRHDVPDEALRRLLSRHSLGIKHLVEPGPDDTALDHMAAAALRAPDHGGLVPYRFAVVRGEARQALGALFERAARDAGKGDEAAAMDLQRALAAPVTVAVIARVDLGHPLVPAHEQWIALGGALANYLHAAHLLGFAGKMLSGRKVRDPQVQAAFCEAGETLVGWIGLGTAAPGAMRRAAAKAGTSAVWSDWTPRGLPGATA